MPAVKTPFSDRSSVITLNHEMKLQQQLINRPYLSQTYNYSGKLTIGEKIFHSYSEYPSKYLGCVNFFSVEQNFGKNEIILKLVNIRMVSLSTFNLQMRNFISWSTIREEKRKDE